MCTKQKTGELTFLGYRRRFFGAIDLSEEFQLRLSLPVFLLSGLPIGVPVFGVTLLVHHQMMELRHEIAFGLLLEGLFLDLPDDDADMIKTVVLLHLFQVLRLSAFSRGWAAVDIFHGEGIRSP